MQALAGAGHGVGAAGGGQEVALALLDRDGLTAAGQFTRAVGDQQRDKALFIGHTVKIAVLGIDGEILTPGEMPAEIMLDRRRAQGHVQRRGVSYNNPSEPATFAFPLIAACPMCFPLIRAQRDGALTVEPE